MSCLLSLKITVKLPKYGRSGSLLPRDLPAKVFDVFLLNALNTFTVFSVQMDPKLCELLSRQTWSYLTVLETRTSTRGLATHSVYFSPNEKCDKQIIKLKSEHKLESIATEQTAF